MEYFKTMLRYLQFVYIFLWGSLALPLVGELQRLGPLQLVPHPGNDGDSFRVTDGEQIYYLRLYFVDCTETSAGTDSMARRVREQTRYFGLESHADTIAFGHLATERMEEWLAEPFFAYTTHADAMGRSTMRRIFAFVVTADGKDLDKLLVRHGLARVYGVGRRDYAGLHRDERRALLEDLEVEAMLMRRGIWSATNPEKIAELRAEERRENRELDAIRRELGLGSLQPGETLDLNNASVEELQRIPGVGPALAQRIVAARPFNEVADLEDVSGIGPASLARFREFLSLGILD